MKTNNVKCDGNCVETHGEHSGEVQPVLVSGYQFPATKFNYCLNAIEEDIKRGFEVNYQPSGANKQG